MKLDLYRSREASGTLLLDCQAAFLAHLSSRLVIPLYPKAEAPELIACLNPTFRIDGEEYVLMTNHASAMLRSELGGYAGSLDREHDAVTAAFDMLLHGF